MHREELRNIISAFVSVLTVLSDQYLGYVIA